MRKRNRNLFGSSEKKLIKDYLILKNGNKLFLGLVFGPPLILLFIIIMASIIKDAPDLLSLDSVGSVFFGGSFCMFIFVELIDMIQATTREFIHDDKKGKLISLILFVTFLFKELFEIAHHHR
ncbi:membrane protein [Clostridium acetobutylicum]|nr:membrane protein [Clostridium acetobutylicum]